MSALDELKKLDQQREKLLQDAKREALDRASQAIKDLNDLGFNYQLREYGQQETGQHGPRRTGIRDHVLTTVKQHPQGISRADVLEAMHSKGDKRAEQSISNALANLKKRGAVTLEDGLYKAA